MNWVGPGSGRALMSKPEFGPLNVWAYFAGLALPAGLKILVQACPKILGLEEARLAVWPMDKSN